MAELFSLLARATLEISAAILVVLALRRPARRFAGAVLAYRLWLLVPLAAAAAFLPPPPMRLSLFPRPPAQAAPAVGAALAPSPLDALDLSAAKGAARPVSGRPLVSSSSAQTLAVLLWGLGLAGVWTVVLVRQRRYLRALGALTPEPGTRRVYRSAAPDVRPALIGSLRPFVVVPRNFNQLYDHQQSTLILAHERTHLAQRHHLQGALGVLLLTAQWFNPLAYLAYRAFRIDQELACDAVVLAAHPRSRAAYAEAMFKSQVSGVPILGAPVPFACQWPGKADHPFKERLTMLSSKSPSSLRRRLAGAALILLLTGGVYVAYAAEPGAPERLAADATGVVGSGDQLSLKVREAQGERTVKVGDTYADGWKLQALTPTKATLAKDGTTREVGLNPTGAIASNTPPAPPTTVTMVGLPSEAMIQAYIDKNSAMFAQVMARAAELGLTEPEMRRYFAETMMVQDELARRYPPGGPTPPAMDVNLLRSILGDAAADDNLANRAKANTAELGRRIADLRANPFSGPSSYYVPAGADPAQVASAQGIDTRGAWRSSAPDAEGGVTRTRTAQTANEVADNMAEILATNPSAIPGAEVRPAQ